MRSDNEEFMRVIKESMNEKFGITEEWSDIRRIISKADYQKACDKIIVENIDDLDLSEIFILARFIVILRNTLFDIDEKTEKEEN